MPAGGGGHQVHRWRGTQGAAWTIQVTGDQIDQLHQPMAQRAECLGRNAHAPVTHGPVRRGKIPRQLADLLGRQRALAAHGLSGKPGDCAAHVVQAVDWQVTGTGQVFGKQRVEQSEQQRGVATGPYKQVLIGNRRRLAAPRVDHHHFAAPGLDGLEALLHVGHGHDAAVGRQRVAAEDQHEVGVVDIRNRQQQAMAVHQVAAEVMRQLVDRRRGKPVACLEQAKEVIAVGHQPVVMHAGIALVHRH